MAVDPAIAGAAIGAGAALLGSVLQWPLLLRLESRREKARRREEKAALYEEYLVFVYDERRMVDRAVRKGDKLAAGDELAARGYPLRARLQLLGSDEVKERLREFWKARRRMQEEFQAQSAPIYKLPVAERTELIALRERLYGEIVKPAVEAVEQAMRVEMGS